MTKTLMKCYDKFKGSCGDGDKGTYHSYIPIYEQYLAAMQYDKFNLLEIGILNGKSIKLWQDFFENANIFAVDIIDKKSLNLEENDRTFIYFGDATKEEFYKLISEHSFRIIIDDGSHKLNDQISSFRLLKNLLDNKGLYIIEDVMPEHITKIQETFGNCFKVLDLRHERATPDNILMIYENN